MTVEKDKYIEPDLKARWGFGGSEGAITVGPQTVGETGGVDHARTTPKDEEAVNNGGGPAGTPAASGAAPADDIDSLTVAQLKERLDARGVSYKSTDAKADLVSALKVAAASEAETDETSAAATPAAE